MQADAKLAIQLDGTHAWLTTEGMLLYTCACVWQHASDLEWLRLAVTTLS